MYFAKRDKNEIQQNIDVFNYEWRDYFIIFLIYILYIFFIWHKLFGVKNSKTALQISTVHPHKWNSMLMPNIAI